MTTATFDRMGSRCQSRIVMKAQLQPGRADSLAHVGEKYFDDVGDKFLTRFVTIRALGYRAHVNRGSTRRFNRRGNGFGIVARWYQPSGERLRQRLHQ